MAVVVASSLPQASSFNTFIAYRRRRRHSRPNRCRNRCCHGPAASTFSCKQNGNQQQQQHTILFNNSTNNNNLITFFFHAYPAAKGQSLLRSLVYKRRRSSRTATCSATCSAFRARAYAAKGQPLASRAGPSINQLPREFEDEHRMQHGPAGDVSRPPLKKLPVEMQRTVQQSPSFFQ